MKQTGTSFVMTPFTADYTIFEQSVASLNTEIIPKGGTNLKSAINSAEELFNKESSNKILILITDGEDLANKGIAEAKKVAGKDVQIFTVGVGTKDGELIPTPNLSGGYLKDRNGNVVKSRLDEEALKNIAQITGGDYRHLSSNGNGILQIYKEKLQELEKSSEQEQRSRIPIDIYRLFLLPAVLLLLIEFVLIGRKPIKKRRILGLLFLINISSISETLYNLGSALYKNGQFEEASEQFDLSLKKASGDLQKQILYNLGNSYYRLSESAKDLNDKIDILKKSLNGYNGAIEIGNKDPQVQKNYDFVKKILDELEKQKKDQQKEDQQKEDQQKEDQQKEDQQKEDQQKEDQQKEDQQKEDQQKEDQQKEDQQKEDQQKEDQQKEDQQISKEDAEDVQFQYLQNSNDK
ncbi:MAG: hypothetical protein B6229_03825 [Spirochaetaceae bacterium 4572_7]|nr:MAG: hypothetical protein B6229_03825 [Spirochaetaceae bacterium 4572_7]